MKPHLRITVQTLLGRGTSQREIERMTGVDRKTIRRIGRELAGAKSPGVATGSDGRQSAVSGGQNPPPPRPPGALARSACEVHRGWIEEQVQLGRNAQAIYQDLVERFGFAHRYNSVKRFVRTLRRREPERFDVLESEPGEEAQVDLGLGAPTLYRTGKYRKPLLFVLTLKYSGKAFRKVVWKCDQQIWARLHEEAFRAAAVACSTSCWITSSSASSRLTCTTESIDEDLEAISVEREALQEPAADRPAKQKPRRVALPGHLPRREIRHEPEQTECSCGPALERIGEDVSEKLGYIPGLFEVERHIRGAARQMRLPTL